MAIIDMAAIRRAFIDQSQSLNIHMADVNFSKRHSMGGSRDSRQACITFAHAEFLTDRKLTRVNG